MKYVINFLIIVGVGVLCSAFPFGPVGILFGLVPVLINSSVLIFLMSRRIIK